VGEIFVNKPLFQKQEESLDLDCVVGGTPPCIQVEKYRYYSSSRGKTAADNTVENTARHNAPMSLTLKVHRWGGKKGRESLNVPMAKVHNVVLKGLDSAAWGN